MTDLSGKHKRIALQLLKEFWIPLLVAGSWAWLGPRSSGEQVFSGFVTRFAPAFFFVSWLLSQLFRVAKQVKTETSLEKIIARLEDVLDEIEQSKRETVAWASGGDSYAYAIPLASGGSTSTPVGLTIVTVGTYPLFKVKARIVDVDAQEASSGSADAAASAQQRTVDLGDLDPPTTYSNRFQLPLEPLADKADRRFNIVFTGRNGQWIQRLRYRLAGGVWQIAYRVDRTTDDEQEMLQHHVAAAFPNPHTIDWGLPVDSLR